MKFCYFTPLNFKNFNYVYKLPISPSFVSCRCYVAVVLLFATLQPVRRCARRRPSRAAAANRAAARLVRRCLSVRDIPRVLLRKGIAPTRQNNNYVGARGTRRKPWQGQTLHCERGEGGNSLQRAAAHHLAPAAGVGGSGRNDNVERNKPRGPARGVVAPAM